MRLCMRRSLFRADFTAGGLGDQVFEALADKNEESLTVPQLAEVCAIHISMSRSNGAGWQSIHSFLHLNTSRDMPSAHLTSGHSTATTEGFRCLSLFFS